MALRTEVVDLIGLDALEQPIEAAAVREVAVVQFEACTRLVRVLVDVVDAIGVEGAGAADDPVDLVALGQEQFREVRAVLPGDARDECALHVVGPFVWRTVHTRHEQA